MKYGYLVELAEIEKSVRESILLNKFRFFGDIYSALHMLNYMSSRKIDTGALIQTFTELQGIFGKQDDNAIELLERIRREILRLLESNGWSQKEFQEKLAA
jgi:hypothetical protein